MVHYDFLTMGQVPLQVVRTWHYQLPSAWRRFASHCVPRLLPRPLVVPRSLALTMRSSLLDNGNAEVWHDLASSLPSIAARFVLPLQPLLQELPVMVMYNNLSRQQCRLTICIELDELSNSIRQQDPDIYSDTEARCLVYDDSLNQQI